MKETSRKYRTLPKALTGIKGLDEITFGGLPLGRPTLVAGRAGCGKTLLAMEFIVRGAMDFKEPGVFISFEETPEELIANVGSLGFNVDELIKKKLIDIDFIRIEKSEIEITGEFDLEGLFIRLGHIVDTIGAKRIALDTIESLFSGISNHAILRAELRRLFRWIKDKGLTAIITGEQGENNLTRQGLEEYVSDCVIFLDHRIKEQYSTRRLRIVKYRGSFHGTNEYPFIIDQDGISVIPITSLKLDHEVSKERVSSGIETLDEMFTEGGFYKGSTILVSGTAGAGKTSILSSFTVSLCSKGQKCLFVAFEESQNQIIRNMKAIGIDLKQWTDKGLLKFHVTRPTYHSLEMHLSLIYKMVNEFNPSAVVVDPISNFTNIADTSEANSLLTRLVDFLKTKKITLLLSNLTSSAEELEKTDVGISSIVDTWLLLRGTEENGERNRMIFIIKSRGMKHSNQVREFLITDKGIKLIDVFVGSEGVLVGSARRARERMDKIKEKQRESERLVLEKNLKRLKSVAEAKIAELHSNYEREELELKLRLDSNLMEVESVENSLRKDAATRQNVAPRNRTKEKKNEKDNSRKK